MPLTSVNSRLGPVSLAMLLCDAVKSTYQTDCALLNSGAVRGAGTYEDVFTYADLRNEVPFAAAELMFPYPVRGELLRNAVRQSRLGWLEGLSLSDSCQCDSGVEFTPDDMDITHINGKPFDPARTYIVALCQHLVEVLFPPSSGGEPLHADAGRAMGTLVVEFFCRRLMSDLIDLKGDGHISEQDLLTFLHRVDTDKSGTVSQEELSAAMAEKTGRPPAPWLLSKMFRLFDADADGTITLSELRMKYDM